MSSNDGAKLETTGSTWSDDRVAYVADLLISQDTVTWTIVSVFMAGETVLLGFYFETSGKARIMLAIVGLAISVVMWGLLARSDTYMTHYMTLLRGTGRTEFNPIATRGKELVDKWQKRLSGMRKRVADFLAGHRSLLSGVVWLSIMESVWLGAWLSLFVIAVASPTLF